jgi:tetratricopeptide (TPR) repeat protein
MDSCLLCGQTRGINPAGLCPACGSKPCPSLGGYALLKELHADRSSTVYLAYRPDLERHFALKLIPPMDEDRKKRFLRSLKAVSALRNPHLIAVHDVGTSHAASLPGHYLAMDYAPGGSLADSKSPVRREVELFQQAADAVTLLHKKNIIHGRIGPDAVLVDGQGRGVLAGFGAPPGPEPDDSAPPFFASPEFARGEPEPTPASDVYSLGATLYFLLTGNTPFADARTRAEYVSLVSVTRPAPPSHCNREISKDFELLVLRSMEAAPEKRIARAGEFLRLLQEAIRKGTLPAGMARKRFPDAGSHSPPKLRTRGDTQALSRQIDARLEPIETLLGHAEQTTRRIGPNEGASLEQALRGCLVLQPDHARTHLLVGRLYRLLERPADASESIEKALALDPGLESAYRYRALVDLTRLLMKRLPELTPTDRGLSFSPMEDLAPEDREIRERAASDLARATDDLARSDDPRQLFTRGVQELFGKDPGIGYEILRRASELLTGDPDCQFFFSLACLHKGDLAAAIEALGKALTLHRSGLALRFMILCQTALARTRKAAGEDPSEAYREGVKHSDDLVKLEPESEDAWARRASLILSMVESMLRQGAPCVREVHEALVITRKMIEKNPEAWRFYLVRGDFRRVLAEVRLERGEPPSRLLDQAEKEYRRAVEIEGSGYQGAMSLASALLLKARSGSPGREALLKETLQLCGRAGELRPGSPVVSSLFEQAEREMQSAETADGG